MYFFQSIIHGRAKHGVRGLALQRSPPVPALPDPHTTIEAEPATAGRSREKGWEEGTEKGQKREEETQRRHKKLFGMGKKGMRRSEMTQEKSEELQSTQTLLNSLLGLPINYTNTLILLTHTCSHFTLMYFLHERFKQIFLK